MTGYLRPLYAESLREFGTPRQLPLCKGWILKRRIPDTVYHDAIGCYPIFACQDWAQLKVDIENIGSDLVTLSMTIDPFAGVDADYLYLCFEDIVIPFKHHFVTDLSVPANKIISKHHRYYTRRALQEITVEVCDNPVQYLTEWVDLYENLKKRHNIGGIQAFSRRAFSIQLQVDGMVMFRAIHEEHTVGIHLWYQQGKVAYSHLAASSLSGYNLGAAYALYQKALGYFSGRQEVLWLNLGAGAGVNDVNSGLTAFKRGWSTGTKTAYFCGRILDREAYNKLVEDRNVKGTDFFPPYRAGEFS